MLLSVHQPATHKPLFCALGCCLSSFSFPELTLTDDMIPRGAWNTGGQGSLLMGGMKVQGEGLLDGLGLTAPAPILQPLDT